MRFNCFATAFLACQLAAFGAELPDGVRRVKVLNYPDCFELANGDTRVTLTEEERNQIVDQTTQCWETAHHASEEDDVEIWKELFGPRFQVKD